MDNQWSDSYVVVQHLSIFPFQVFMSRQKCNRFINVLMTEPWLATPFLAAALLSLYVRWREFPHRKCISLASTQPRSSRFFEYQCEKHGTYSPWIWFWLDASWKCLRGCGECSHSSGFAPQRLSIKFARILAGPPTISVAYMEHPPSGTGSIYLLHLW